MRFGFRDCVLDLARHELHRGDEQIHLTPKAMELLAILITNRPALISKHELMDRLWPDVIVVPANLRNLIAEIRGALGDEEADGRLIRTVHGCGYGFTDRVEVIAAHDSRVVVRLSSIHDPQVSFRLQSGPNLVGRGPDCDLMIESSEVSRHHARITVAGESIGVEDLQSRNGTFVSGIRVHRKTPLSHGDEIAFGAVPMRLKSSHPETQTVTSSFDRLSTLRHIPTDRG